MSLIQFQRNRVSVGNGSTQAITAVSSLDNAFCILNNNRMQSGGPSSTTGNQSASDMALGVEMTAVDELTFRSAGTIGSVEANYEVWEYTGAVGGPHEFIVRDRIVAVLDGTTNTFSVNNVVDRNRCVCFVTGITTTLNSQDAYASTAIAYLTANNSMQVQGQRGSGTTTVYVTVVEFTGSAWTVSYGRGISGADSGTFNLVDDSSGQGGSAASVNWNNSFVYGLCKAGDTSNVALADHWPRFLPEDSSSYRFTYDSQHDGSHELMAYVVENGSMNVSRFSSTVSHNGAANVNISGANLTALNNATSLITRQSSGTGTAYGRNWVSSRLTSLTNLEMYVHRDRNTILTEIQVMDLAGLAVIGVTSVDGDNQFLVGQTGVSVQGFNFEAVQGTGTVELWDDITGTTRVAQTVVSWSDTEVVIDIVAGGITDNATRYIVLTNDSGDVTAAFAVFFGLPPLEAYNDIITNSQPDHRWRLNNDAYADTGVFGGSPMTQSVQGDGGSFETVPICEGVTHSWLADNRIAREAPDNDQMNLETETVRTMCGWYRINQIAKDLSCIYKEGGGVNNVCFFIGMGNTLIAQLADTGDDNVQAYSDFPLDPNRAYHILWTFDYNAPPAEFRLWIDGRLQSATAGNPLLATDLDAHSGDIIFAGLDGNVEVAGTDVLFTNQESAYYNEWNSWRESFTPEFIRDSLFRRGAIPVHTITTDTPANMQAQLDALANSVIPNSPLGIRIETPGSGVIDLDLSADNIVFDERITEFVEWRGGGTLNWTNLNGSNLQSDKWFAPRGGNVNVINPATLTLTGLQNPTEVRVYEAGTTNELAGEENVTSGTFSATIQVNSVDIVIAALEYQNIRLTNVDTTSDTTLPIQQRFDRNYSNPP